MKGLNVTFDIGEKPKPYSTDLNCAIELWNPSWDIKKTPTMYYIDSIWVTRTMQWARTYAPEFAIALCKAFLIERLEVE